MKKTAIIYSSTDGHTVRICEKIIEMIKHKSKVSLCSIEKADSLDLDSFDFILSSTKTNLSSTEFFSSKYELFILFFN